MDYQHIHLDYFENVFRARKGYSRVLDPVCSQWDLTRNELDVILFLYNNPDYDRASDVAARRGMAKSHVSLSVANLEAKGLLRRKTDPSDRRTIRLELLGDAWDIARQGRDAQKAFFSRIFQGLTPEEIAQWVAILDKVTKNIAALN